MKTSVTSASSGKARPMLRHLHNGARTTIDVLQRTGIHLVWSAIVLLEMMKEDSLIIKTEMSAGEIARDLLESEAYCHSWNERVILFKDSVSLMSGKSNVEFATV